MENLYVFVVGLLFLLAFFDLVVGVSNDAVNFLNSAIGSKVAKFRTILIIASVGIMLGAMSSGGMMEVARKGIYNPQHFYFNELMVLFLAVMIADIILLDLFNTFGLPTSTTVSIVFELLGASFALSIFKVLEDGSPMNILFNIDNPEAGVVGYMNWSNAGEIIIGILLSVVIAFTVGALVQFVSRYFFSFRYHSQLKLWGSVFSGFAFTAILYFLLFKALGSVVKGVAPEDMNVVQSGISQFYEWINVNLMAFMLGILVVFIIIMYVVQRFNVNPLRLVVLFGTFALAMAFAGNDLVNFIGVPVSGWQAYELWSSSGQAPNELLMTGLAGQVGTPYFMLMMAGVIMTLSLWFSKKSRSVTETEVNLGAQSEIDERFEPNLIARMIVNSSAGLNNIFKRVIPGPILDKVNTRFAPLDVTETEGGAAHFDLLRASINLVTSAILIAIATDMKLPLSTTYVTFMVAMGTSLADRAWGRESAVYRIAGVMNVIGGWFMTAFVAFTIAGVFAALMYYGGLTGIIISLALVVFSIYKTSKYHTTKLKQKEMSTSRTSIDYKDVGETLGHLTTNVEQSIGDIKRTLELTYIGILKENKRALSEANRKLNDLNSEYAMMKSGLYKIIKKNQSHETTSSHLYVLTYDLMQDILQSLSLIVDSGTVHVKNNHKPLTKKQVQAVYTIREHLTDYLTYIQLKIREGDLTDNTVQEINIRKTHILREIEEATSLQIEGIMDRKYGFKNSSLFLTLLMELKDLVAVSARFAKLYKRIYQEGKLTK